MEYNGIKVCEGAALVEADVRKMNEYEDIMKFHSGYIDEELQLTTLHLDDGINKEVYIVKNFTGKLLTVGAKVEFNEKENRYDFQEDEDGEFITNEVMFALISLGLGAIRELENYGTTLFIGNRAYSVPVFNESSGKLYVKEMEFTETVFRERLGEVINAENDEVQEFLDRMVKEGKLVRNEFK